MIHQHSFVVCLMFLAFAIRSESTQRFPEDKKPSEGSSGVCKGDGWFAGSGYSCFKPIKNPKTHDKAEKLCEEAVTGEESQEDNPRLAIIKTPEEQVIVSKIMYKTQEAIMRKYEKKYTKEYEEGDGWGVWLGARRVPDTNTFKWDDGSEMNWTNWAPNEPKGWETDADCVALSSSRLSDSKWKTVKCYDVELPLCQKIPNAKLTPE